MNQDLKPSILVHTSEYRGDHTAEICIALDYVQGETVDSLLDRAGMIRPNFDPRDWIAIRIFRDRVI